jgi:hypothetical protein
MQTNVEPSVGTSFTNADLHDLKIQFNRLVDLVSHLMPGVPLTDAESKAGTTDATTWRTEAFTFTFRGKTTSAAAAETAFTNSTHDVAASKEAWFVLSVQTNGTTFTITKGADQTIGTKVLPTTPDNEVPVAYLQIVTGATGWLATDDDLAADGAKIASYEFWDVPSVKKIGNESGVEVTV